MFETKGKKKYNRGNISRQIERFKKRHNINLVTNPHNFRHSRATSLMEEGFSIKAISKYLRHSNPTTTSKFYIHDKVDFDVLEDLDKNKG